MKNRDKYDPRKWDIVPIYDDRSYLLFSMLAGVRNDYGIQPIDFPRGLPKDCSKRTLIESEYLGSDGHSHSYFILKELLYHKDKKVIYANDEYEPLHSLVDPLIDRTCEEFWIFHNKEEKIKEVADKIRIVFWFDN